jgi:hypothetical protein
VDAFSSSFATFAAAAVGRMWNGMPGTRSGTKPVETYGALSVRNVSVLPR